MDADELRYRMDTRTGIWSLRFSADGRELVAGASDQCLYGRSLSVFSLSLWDLFSDHVEKSFLFSVFVSDFLFEISVSASLYFPGIYPGNFLFHLFLLSLFSLPYFLPRLFPIFFISPSTF